METLSLVISIVGLGLSLFTFIFCFVRMKKQYSTKQQVKNVETETPKAKQQKSFKKKEYILINGVPVEYDPEYKNVFSSQLDDKTKDLIKRSEME